MEDLSKQQMRKKFRQERKSLSKYQQSSASHSISSQLTQLILESNAQTVACYLPNDGEVDLRHFIQQCWSKNISVCLPVLHPFSSGYLLFIDYPANSRLAQNQFGIFEPNWDVNQVRCLGDIDIIFSPLVAFSEDGNRLGMGGGYYDRTLSCLDRLLKKPTLAGIAHDCQQAALLPTEIWDIPMDWIVTPTRVIRSN